jgi:anti-anti-sigma factor
MSEDAEDADPWWAEPLHIAVFREGGEVTVVAGGLDRSGAERFRAHVMEALGKRPAVLTIDASALTSVDSVGLAGLLGVRHAVADAGVAFRVSGASPAFRHAAEDHRLQRAASRRVTRGEPGTPARHRYVPCPRLLGDGSAAV